LLFNVGLAKPKLPESGQCVLIYHGIDDGEIPRVNTKFISKSLLETQLRWLKKHTTIVPAKDLFEPTDEDKGFRIAITFDDGFANNHKYLLALVEKLEIPITIFVTTIRLKDEDFLWPDALDLFSKNGPDKIKVEGEEYRLSKGDYQNSNGAKLKFIAIEKGYSFAKQAIQSIGFNAEKLAGYPEDLWRMLTETELMEIAQSEFVTIGAHGVTHNSFIHMSNQELTSELTESRDYLQRITNQPIDEIAYPYGHYNSNVINLVE